jgi:hypothetical protein
MAVLMQASHPYLVAHTHRGFPAKPFYLCTGQSTHVWIVLPALWAWWDRVMYDDDVLTIRFPPGRESSQDSVVNKSDKVGFEAVTAASMKMTDCLLGCCWTIGFDSRMGRISLFAQHPNRLRGPPSILCSGYRGTFLCGKTAAYLNLVPRFRMRGVIPALPCTSACVELN